MTVDMREFANWLLTLRVRDVVPGGQENDDRIFVYRPAFDTTIKASNQRTVDNWFFRGRPGLPGEWTTMELGVRGGGAPEVLAWDNKGVGGMVWRYEDDTPSLERLQKWCMMIEAMHSGS